MASARAVFGVAVALLALASGGRTTDGVVMTSGLGDRTGTAASLVPAKPQDLQTSPLYWCSWLAQGRMWLHEAANDTGPEFDRFWHARTHEAWMDQSNEVNAFTNSSSGARTGWAWYFSRARQDMVFLLDNGWQDGPESASHLLQLNTTGKFPMLAAPTAEAVLAKYVALVRAQGWRGAGLWVSGGEGLDAAHYRMLNASGMAILKFDGGDDHCTQTALARQYAPALVVEHGHCGGACPLNSANYTDGRWPMSAAESQADVLACSDLFRTYDMVKLFSVAEVIDRQAKLLLVGHNHSSLRTAHAAPGPAPRRLFGGSGEPSVTAGLGGAIQPMRGSVAGSALPAPARLYMGEGPGSRSRQHRQDEIVRLARWSRIAPPFSVGLSGREPAPLLDSTILYDSHNFSTYDDACVISHGLAGKVVRQGAPARVTRNGLPLPDVAVPSEGPPPFVLATRFPNADQPISVSALGRRLTNPNGYFEPRADVRLAVPTGSRTFGVFGHFASLTLCFPADIGRPTVLAQDLAGDTPRNITADVEWSGPGCTPGSAAAAAAAVAVEDMGVRRWPHSAAGSCCLAVKGSTIDAVGLEARSSAADQSPPGLVLVLS